MLKVIVNIKTTIKLSLVICSLLALNYILKYCTTKYYYYSFRLPQLTVAIELVNEISRQLMDRKTEAVNEISCTFEELERVLHQRKTALITDLENICSSKQKVRNRVLPQ